MPVGVLQFRLRLHDSGSLKDKRRVVRGLMDRLRNDFGVSVAEVGARDHHQEAHLELALVLAESRAVASALDRIIDFLGRGRAASLVDHQAEVL